jgi:hypothetical protein
MNKNDARLAVDQVAERLEAQQEKLVYAERTAGVLRAANAHLRKKLDAALLQRDEARALYAGLEQGYEQANRERVAALDENDARDEAERLAEIKVADLREKLAHMAVERDALKGIVASLHERAVRATEALGVVYDRSE